MPNSSPSVHEALDFAFQFAAPLYRKKLLPTGEEPLAHAVHTAKAVLGMGLDRDTVVAAMLNATPEVMPNYYEEISKKFGYTVAELIEGGQRLAEIPFLKQKITDSTVRTENLSKLLLVAVGDTRVVLIKLVEHAESMRFLAGKTNKPLMESFARQALDIFAPIAGIFGLWPIKAELEDLAFHALQPEAYEQIIGALAQKRVDREAYVLQLVNKLRDELNKASIDSEIAGRPKPVYSIYREMQAKGTSVDQIRDLHTLTILVSEIKNCYHVLGMTHALWAPISDETQDFIARPKSNRYRSLHTIVIGPEGREIDVQIRTFAMHRESEYGIAADLRRRDNLEKADFDIRPWLRRVLAHEEKPESIVERPTLPTKQLRKQTACVYVPETVASDQGMFVVVVDNLKTVPAQCCKPVPVDPIVGFVTPGRGVFVHQRTCEVLKRLPKEHFVLAEWGKTGDERFLVKIAVGARDREGLADDITKIFQNEHADVLSIEAYDQRQTKQIYCTVQVSDRGQLYRALNTVRGIQGVINARNERA